MSGKYKNTTEPSPCVDTIQLNEIDEHGKERYNQMMATLLLLNLSNSSSYETRAKVRNSATTGNSYLVKPLGKGSTGRTTANNLKEHLAMEEVMSNPAGTKINVKMADSRWLGSDGWSKYSQNVNGVEIHYNYNYILDAYDDFKFK